MDNKVSVSELVQWTAWVVGVGGLFLVSLGAVDYRHQGAFHASLVVGSLTYMRQLVRGQRRREDRAFEMGRLAGPPPENTRGLQVL